MNTQPNTPTTRTLTGNAMQDLGHCRAVLRECTAVIENTNAATSVDLFADRLPTLAQRVRAQYYPAGMVA